MQDVSSMWHCGLALINYAPIFLFLKNVPINSYKKFVKSAQKCDIMSAASCAVLMPLATFCFRSKTIEYIL